MSIFYDPEQERKKTTQKQNNTWKKQYNTLTKHEQTTHKHRSKTTYKQNNNIRRKQHSTRTKQHSRRFCFGCQKKKHFHKYIYNLVAKPFYAKMYLRWNCTNMQRMHERKNKSRPQPHGKNPFLITWTTIFIQVIEWVAGYRGQEAFEYGRCVRGAVRCEQMEWVLGLAVAASGNVLYPAHHLRQSLRRLQSRVDGDQVKHCGQTGKIGWNTAKDSNSVIWYEGPHFDQGSVFWENEEGTIFPEYVYRDVSLPRLQTRKILED